ncbi:hypothetical protein C5F59_004685 [Streptomyces sp. QL37]|uniref:hypothetical protein n=1 Tax=Streptomyces sp. QL37 TaxID=2093747 RepID=UPI000CF26751|nr:hypothetical protein [Streptomyces sp. QL37]PPQ56079.1 hypothetical protein C5F59_04725 [Streptomyces sp. QL37]
MTTDPTTAADLEALRRAELARREERRRARQTGLIPSLRARGRAASAEPVISAIEAVVEDPIPGPAEVPAPLRLSDRAMAVLERVAAEAGAPGFVGEALLRAGREIDPESALAYGVCDLLAGLPPLSAIRHLVDLAAAGLPVLHEDQRVRAEMICSGRAPAPDVAPATIDAWQLHLEAVEAEGHGTLPTVAWQRLVEQLPQPIVDDLIDRGVLRRQTRVHTWPRESERVRYATARLSPQALTDEEVAGLEWRDEACRRTLWSGGTVDVVDGRHDQWSLRSALLVGETAALDDVEPQTDSHLPEDLAELVAELKEVKRGGPVGWRSGQDPSLFGLLEDCLPSGRLISGRTSFHYWAGTRRLYRLLDDVHWAMACDPDDVADARAATVRQAAALRNGDTRSWAASADREARAVQAYLQFLGARRNDRERFDRGVGLLEEVLKRGGARRGGVGGKERHRMTGLSELLQTLRLNGRPNDVLNPYLALCVEHGSNEWRQGWRDLRTQVPAEQLEYINGAKDRIKRMETAQRLGERPETVYALPLNEKFLWVPGIRNEVLLPAPRPMARRTAASTQEEQLWTATGAAREIIGRNAERLRNNC